MTLNSLSLSLNPQRPLISIHLNLLWIPYLRRFSLNCLALNPDKSDAILLGTRQCNNSLPNISHINVAGSMVRLSETVKHLSVTLDKPLTFHKHVNQSSQSCYYYMKALRHIRHCLDDQTASRIAHALISSDLDYANFILLGSPNYMSSINFSAFRTLSPELSSSLIAKPTRSLLRQLHWLPVQSRICFMLNCQHYIQSPLYQLPAIPCFTYPLPSTCPFSSLL